MTTTLPPGHPHLARFTLGPLLARGGCALIYAATDTDGSDAVVKVAANPAQWPASALEHEARVARHVGPGDAPEVLDVCTHGPVPFIAYRRIHGRTLLDVLHERGPVCALAALALAQRLGRALEGIHAAGVAHLDLSPSNIIVTPDQGLRLIDFAGSALMGSPIPGEVLGTPGYAAPERMPGMRATGGMDVFAFAAVLYRALAGAAPGTHPATHDARGRILRVDRLRPDVGGAVGDILRAGLHPQPEHRPRTPRELARAFAHAMPVPDDVDEWHEHNPVLTPSST